MRESIVIPSAIRSIGRSSRPGVGTIGSRLTDIACDDRAGDCRESSQRLWSYERPVRMMPMTVMAGRSPRETAWMKPNGNRSTT